MTGKLLDAPAPHYDNIAKIADFAELCALSTDDGNVSQVDVARYLARGQGDAENNDADLDTRSQNVTEDAFAEIEQRSAHCGMASDVYPFELNASGTLIQRKTFSLKRHPQRYLYLYLLLATRMNMNREKMQGGYDATVLFEELSKEILMNYLGAPSAHVKGMVFGTARYEDTAEHEDVDVNSFSSAVNALCVALGEGIRFRARQGVSPKKKDDKLDVVAWREFSDGRCGKLIGFGQCKTGSNWDRDVGRLNPSGFAEKWMEVNPAVHAIKTYFVADRVVRNFTGLSIDAGIFFDRCRILDYSNGISTDLLDKIVTWTQAAMSSHGMNC